MLQVLQLITVELQRVSYIVGKSAPRSLPKDADYLARFIRNELKAQAKKETLRLVKGWKA
jgi:hypothetical protein